MDTLITDRTARDHYDTSDLNRVGEAMQYVAARLRSCGWDIEISPRTDWRWTDKMTWAEAKRYISNLRKIREALTLFATTPALPGDVRPFNAQEANDIEKILLDIEDMVRRTEAAYHYSGDVFAGEV